MNQPCDPHPFTAARPQRVVVFQQQNSAAEKIKGLGTYGGDAMVVTVIDIDESLPPVIDDASEYLPDTVSADLVLDFLKHPDLSMDLGLLCRRHGIPVVASGKQSRPENVITPPT